MRLILIIFSLFYTFSTLAQAAELKQQKQLVFKGLKGEHFDLQKSKSQIIIVNFWAYWCPECIAEMAVLNELYEKYRQSGLEIVGLSIDKKEERNEAIKRAGVVSYPNAMAEDASSNNFNEVVQVPMTYILDQDHRIADVISKFDESAESLLRKIVESRYQTNYTKP